MPPVEEVVTKRYRLTCTRCGHVWYAKTAKLPGTCANPRCKSKYWNEPYTEEYLQRQAKKKGGK